MMRFSCTRCGKRYVTHDVPVPGRTYRLRCKACGELIVVKGGVFSPAPSRPEDSETGQFAPPAEATGSISPLASLLGAADEPLAPPTVPTPVPTAGGPGEAPRPPAPAPEATPSPLDAAPPAPPEATAAAAPKYIELFDPSDPEAAPVDSPLPPPVPVRTAHAQASSAEGLPVRAVAPEQAPPPADGEPQAAPGQTTEDVVRDFLAPLEPEPEPESSPIARDVIPVPLQAPRTAPSKTSPAFLPARRRPAALLPAIGVGVVLLGGAGLALWRHGASGASRGEPHPAPAPQHAELRPAPAPKPAPEPKQATPAAEAPALAPPAAPPEGPAASAAAAPEPASPAPALAPAGAAGAPEPSPAARTTRAESKRLGAPPPRPPKAAKPAERKVAAAERHDAPEAEATTTAPPAQGAPPAAPAPAEAAGEQAAAADLPNGLTPEQIHRVLGGARRSIDACLKNPSRGLDQPLGERQVTLRFVVEPGGSVTYPTIDDVTISSAPVGQCLKAAAKALTFPAFRGDPVSVDQAVNIPAR